MAGENGTPDRSSASALICQPRAIAPGSPFRDVASGSAHVAFIASTCLTSKSAGPRSLRGSIGFCGNTELLTPSLPTCPCVRSSAFPSVYDTCQRTPLLNRFVAANCNASYQERPPAVLRSIESQLGFLLGAPAGKNIVPSARICGTTGFPSIACTRLDPREPA